MKQQLLKKCIKTFKKRIVLTLIPALFLILFTGDQMDVIGMFWLIYMEVRFENSLPGLQRIDRLHCIRV